MAKRYKFGGQEIEESQAQELKKLATLGKIGLIDDRTARGLVTETLMRKPSRYETMLRSGSTAGNTTSSPQTQRGYTGQDYLRNQMNKTSSPSGVNTASSGRDYFFKNQGVFAEGGILTPGSFGRDLLEGIVSIPRTKLINPAAAISQTLLSGKPLSTGPRDIDKVSEALQRELQAGRITPQQYNQQLQEATKTMSTKPLAEIAPAIQSARPVAVSQREADRYMANPAFEGLKGGAEIASFAIPGTGVSRLAVSGALQGFGSAEPGSEIEGALTGSLFGGGIGVGSKILGGVASRIANRTKGTGEKLVRAGKKAQTTPFAIDNLDILAKEGVEATGQNAQRIQNSALESIRKYAKTSKKGTTPYNVTNSIREATEAIAKESEPAYAAIKGEILLPDTIARIKKTGVFTNNPNLLKPGSFANKVIDDLTDNLGTRANAATLRKEITRLDSLRNKFGTDAISTERDQVLKDTAQVLRDELSLLIDRSPVSQEVKERALGYTQQLRDLSIVGKVARSKSGKDKMYVGIGPVGDQVPTGNVISRIATRSGQGVEAVGRGLSGLSDAGSRIPQVSLPNFMRPLPNAFTGPGLASRAVIQGQINPSIPGLPQPEGEPVPYTEEGYGTEGGGLGSDMAYYEQLKSAIFEDVITGAMDPLDGERMIKMIEMQQGSGGNNYTDKQVNVLNAERSLVDLKNRYDRAVGTSFGQGRLGGTLSNLVGSVTELAPEVSSYNKLRTSIRSQLARALGEIGNLAQAEQEAVLDAIPQITDGPEEARLKWEYIFDMLEGTKANMGI